MKEMITSLRIGQLFCLLHTGNQPDWKTRTSTELFATQVMPHLRGLWPEYEDDNRRWIHPLEDRVDPTVDRRSTRPRCPRSSGDGGD